MTGHSSIGRLGRTLGDHDHVGDTAPTLDAALRSTLGPAAESQNVVLRLEVPESIELSLERARVERVFINLIGNALEAMPDGGTICIRATSESENALIEVEDTGPGIAPEIREHLFQPFVSSGKRNGLGLGLALSRQTILDHGGDMWVESEAGHGARFMFRLPLRKPAMAAARKVASSVEQVHL